MKILGLAAVILGIALMQYGCSDTESTPGLGFMPKIRNARAFNVNDPENRVAASTFEEGDLMDFTVRVEDGDFDMKAVFATEYFVNEEDETETLIAELQDSDLIGQTAQIMNYPNLFPRTVVGPVGKYRIHFVAEDERGNRSIDFFLEYNVE